MTFASRALRRYGDPSYVRVGGDYTIFEETDENSGVPEPASLIVWTLSLGALGFVRSRRKRKAA